MGARQQSPREFLQDYAGLQSRVRAQPSKQDDESLTGYLRRVGAIEDDTKTAPPKLQARAGASAEPDVESRPAQAARAQKNAAREQERQAEEAAIAAEAEARRKKAQTAGLIGKGLAVAGIAPNKAADFVERLQTRIANLPTPGGRGAMLLLLLLFIIFIVPVAANYTRAQLFWLTLLGRTSLDDSGAPERDPIAKPPGERPPLPKPNPPGGRPPDITTAPPGSPGGLPLPS